MKRAPYGQRLAAFAEGKDLVAGIYLPEDKRPALAHDPQICGACGSKKLVTATLMIDRLTGKLYRVGFNCGDRLVEGGLAIMRDKWVKSLPEYQPDPGAEDYWGRRIRAWATVEAEIVRLVKGAK